MAASPKILLGLALVHFQKYWLWRIVWENTSLCSIRGLMMESTFVMQHWKLMAAILKHSKEKSSFALREKPWVIPHLLLLAFWSAFWSFFCSPAFVSRSAVKGWNGKRQSHHKLKTVCPFLAQVKFIMLNPIWTESQGHCALKYGFTRTFPRNQDVIKVWAHFYKILVFL